MYDIITESHFYKSAVAKGVEQGIEKGRQQGVEEGQRYA
jgi:predicted transposase YdaD